jgi:hypothetical protein
VKAGKPTFIRHSGRGRRNGRLGEITSKKLAS